MTAGGLPFVLGDRDVLRVLLARRAAASVPGARVDDHRVALVLGGGGMRGAYMAGMLRTLERAGLTPAFDEVYGSSSGAISAAAFLTGAAAGCAACYPEDLATKRFLDLRRIGSGRPALNLSLLIDDVLSGSKPMAWERLGVTPGRLHIVATDVSDLRPHTLTGMADAADWRTALRASASIPLIAGPPVAWAGHRWVDGSVGEPLAVARAVRGGATHVLALLNRGASERHPDPDAAFAPWARALDRVVPGLGTVMQGSRRYGADLQVIEDVDHPARGPARLCAIAPERTAGVGSLTVEAGPLAEAVTIGDETCQAALAATAARDLDPA